MAMNSLVKITFLCIVLTMVLVAMTGSTRAQSNTVNCDGVPFQPDVVIGRISYSMTAQQVCAVFQSVKAAAPNDSWASAIVTAQDIQSTAKENIALALDAFRWRDPVIYDMVMKQYGLTVGPKQ